MRVLAVGVVLALVVVALAWVLAISEQTLLIPGTSSLDHLEENLAAGTLELSAADLAEIEQG